MKKQITEEVKIPEGIEVQIDESEIIVKGPKGENRKDFRFGKVKVENKNGSIVLGHEKSTKKEKKMINTIAAHIRNMMQGVQENFEYKLKIAASHFPMSVEVKGREAIIKNFIGEKTPRHVKIPEGAEVKIEKDIITITSQNKEVAGQAAANFESATRIRKRDRRVFQDGIYIIEKAGRKI